MAKAGVHEEEVLAGRYRVGALLGSGGMGEVFRAVHIELGREVAIKRLKKDLLLDQSVLKRFINEARAVNVIRHENIVEVTDFFNDSDGRVHMVMELLEGRSLGELIRARAPLPPARCAHIAAQIAEALQAAHAHGVIHRDLKPENVFLIQRKSTDDYVKLLDFGIARLHPDCGGIEATESGLIIGTPVYMPPEQATGGTVTWAADAYSLGVILYEMLTGKWPFERGSAVQMMMAHIADPPPPLDVPGLPDGFRELVESLLAKHPGDRPAHMQEIVRRLEDWAEHTRLTESDVLPARGMSDTQLPSTANKSAAKQSAQTWDLPGDLPGALPEDLPRQSLMPPAPTVEGPGLPRKLVVVMAAIVLIAAGISYLLIQGRSTADPALATQADAALPTDPRDQLDLAMDAFGFPPSPADCKTHDPAAIATQTRILRLLRSGGPGSARQQDRAALQLLAALASDMSPETSLWNARVQLQLGNAEESIKHARLAYQSCPELSAALATEGTALAYLGKHKEARDKYQEALQLHGDYVDASFNLALSQVAMDEPAPAVAGLNDMLYDNPRLPGAHALRGQAYLQMGDLMSAKLDLEIAVRISEDNAGTWFALGYARSETGDSQGASEAYCRARALGHPRAPCAKDGESRWPEDWEADRPNR